MMYLSPLPYCCHPPPPTHTHLPLGILRNIALSIHIYHCPSHYQKFYNWLSILMQLALLVAVNTCKSSHLPHFPWNPSIYILHSPLHLHHQECQFCCSRKMGSMMSNPINLMMLYYYELCWLLKPLPCNPRNLLPLNPTSLLL